MHDQVTNPTRIVEINTSAGTVGQLRLRARTPSRCYPGYEIKPRARRLDALTGLDACGADAWCWHSLHTSANVGLALSAVSVPTHSGGTRDDAR